MILPTFRRAAGALLLLSALTACHHEPGTGRGAGLSDARLSPEAQARVYTAAMSASFTIAPNLSLLVDPSMLPRGEGNGPGPALPAPVQRAMIASGVFRGTCTPQPGRAEQAPICDAPMPGYVVRVSDVFRLSPDSLQVYVQYRRYDTRATAPHAEFRFEEIHQLARRAGRWETVRKARLRV